MDRRAPRLVVTSAAVVALCLATASGAGAAVIAPATTDDTVANDGVCSLREAITAANTNAATGGCPKGDGPDTIMLGATTYTLTRSGPIVENANDSGDVDVTSGLTLTGAGMLATVVNGGGIDRVLHVLSGTVRLEGLTITGGAARDGGSGGDAVGGSAGPGSGATGGNATGGSGGDGAAGGGIFNAGSLTLVSVRVAANSAGDGGAGGDGTGGDGGSGPGGGGAGGGGGRGDAAPGGDGGAGGGIFSSGTLTLDDCEVVDNRAGLGGDGGNGTGGRGGDGVNDVGGAGGGSSGGAGRLGGDGGGIWWSAPVTITDSTIAGNQAGDGGDGGDGRGGRGGTGGGSSAGGVGGFGNALWGQSGGNGGGLGGTAAATISGTTVTANSAGDNGAAGAAIGGRGGNGGPSSGVGGAGGSAESASAGIGGGGGGLALSAGGTIVNSTFHDNASGNGSPGGSARGGNGGDNGMLGAGGPGGDALASDGRDAGSGGAIRAMTATIRHVTISGNRTGVPGAAGAGIAGTGGFAGGASGTGTHGTPGAAGVGGGINAQPATTVANTIVAANAPTNCVPLTDGGNNLSFPDGSCPGAVADPLLAALAENGGPTATLRPLAGSAALDAVPASGAGCEPRDQRAVVRPNGPACDIGAYEVAPPVAITGGASDVTATAARLGGAVDPSGLPTSYRFEYGGSTDYGTVTPDADAGTGITVASVAADVAGLAPAAAHHFRLVATNVDGTSFGADQTFTTQALPPAPPGQTGDGIAPRFLTAAMSPTTFAVNPTGLRETAVQAQRRRIRRGTTFRYSLSEAARVLFTIQRARPGRRVGGRCRKPTRANRTRPRCTRYVRIGRFAQLAGTGTIRKRFSGRIGRRTLRPGRHRAVLVATDAAGNRSTPRRLRFRIVRPR